MQFADMGGYDLLVNDKDLRFNHDEFLGEAFVKLAQVATCPKETLRAGILDIAILAYASHIDISLDILDEGVEFPPEGEAYVSYVMEVFDKVVR